MSNVVIRCTEVERHHLKGTSVLKVDLAKALVRLYTAILKYLLAADDFFGKSRARRVLTGLVQTKQSGVGELFRHVQETEDEVQKVIPLVIAEGLLHLQSFWRY